ncbi:MAG: flagellin [Lachnospiraceae bacterium]|nr:flagellin [Lachnospiraceae bacterium]
MVVQHNMQAANANRMLGITTGAQAKSTEKLSSGYKINRAADDAAGLAISEKMRSQVRGLDRASTNAQDGISVVQTAEGALNEVHSMLQRMNELATQAANDTNTTQDRSQIKLEINQLTSEIDRVSSTTQFNTMNLLDGSFSDKNLQVGSLSGQNIKLSIGEMSAKGLGLTRDAKLATHATVNDFGTGAKTAGTDSTTADFKTSTGLAKGTYEYDSASKTWHNNNVTATVDLTAIAKDTDTKLGFSPDVESGKANATITVDDAGKVTASTGIVTGGISLAKTGTASTTLAVLNNTSYDVGADTPDGTYTAGADGTFSDGNGHSFKLTFSNGAKNDLVAAEGTTVTVSGHNDALDTDALKVDTNAHAGSTMKTIQDAIDKVSTQRASLGAVQNRLEHTIANLDNVSENTQAAESRIRDTDMAKEMVTYSKNNILAQAGQSMLAQANQSNQGVLSLLQ